MAHVAVGPRFFYSELRVYSNWRIAFARELIQNAVDAAATRITIDIHVNDAGHAVVTFYDDGEGMDREVLERVYFRLGETTKNGGGTIGGYGRARMITCFAQRSYEIATHDLRVEGCGGEYDITVSDEFVSGARFTIETLDDETDRLEAAFRNFLRTCSLTVPVTLNGAEVHGRSLPSRARRIFRDEHNRAWGKVYTPNGPVACAQMFVRVSGLTMFSEYLDGESNIIVELEPNRAREVMAASRDRLTDPYTSQLDTFRSDLIRNQRAAFTPESPPLRVHISGGGFLTAGRPVEADHSQPQEDTTDTAVHSGPGLSERAVEPARAAAFTTLEDAPQLFDTDEHGETPREQLGFDVFMLADTTDTRVRALARTWHPSGWDASVGRRRRALLLAWKAAVEACLDALTTMAPKLGPVSFTVGWTFDDDARAVHQQLAEGHVLALNPVNKAGKIRYRITSRDDLRAVLASALHEVCHVVVSGHDEDFASVLTRLTGKVDQLDAIRAMEAAASRA